MKCVLQRVQRSELYIQGEQRAVIGHGMVVLVGFAPGDEKAQLPRMAERLLGYRIFEDESGRMNRDVRDVSGQMLLVPNFTLYADTRRGRRPGFSEAAPPAMAQPLFEAFCQAFRPAPIDVQFGVFGADMQLELVNDGPVTLIIEG